MKQILLGAALMTATSPALAGGEPYPAYYREAPPPVIVTAPPVYAPPPPPFVALGAGIGGLVTGAVSLPFALLGGIAVSIVPPVVSCVAPDGSLFPCAAGPGYPAYPPPSYGPGYPPPYPERGITTHRSSGSGPCYDGQGRFIGEGNPEC
jgi:hypothetical protein